MMNILITAPNLNSEINVSGISTVVNSIIDHNTEHNYFHFEIGKKDKKKPFFYEIIQLIYRIIFFPYFLKRHQINLIHQNVPFDFKGVIREFILNRIGKLLQIKSILHIHGGTFLFTKPKNYLIKYCIQTLLNTNEKVLVLSELERNSLAINYGLKNSIVLPNAISIHKKSLIKTFSKVPVFLFFGRIHENKGIFDIIEMFKKLKNDFEFKFVLYGDGPCKELVINELFKILGDKFIFGGILSGSNKMDVIFQADFFLLPSKFEGLPMALLESMSMGLIPIVTNVGSMDLLIKDGFNGIKVNKNNIDDLYLKTKKILQDSNLQNEISKNAIHTVVNFHNIENYIIALNSIYNS